MAERLPLATSVNEFPTRLHRAYGGDDGEGRKITGADRCQQRKKCEREWKTQNLKVSSIDSIPLPEACGCQRDWAASFMKGAAPESKDSWVMEDMIGLPMQVERKQASAVEPEHHEVFNRLLEDPVVQRFLAWDRNLRVSDKYLLSMVIAYFSRAGLFSWQYQQIHFFLALYLANDMEEDNQATKQAIFSFLYGKNCIQRPMFHKLQIQFIRSMRWNT
ncbi:speedy protein E4-like [Tamandua tetradactyla]|uniref:speedy protein E4-like n=1 Tax=Tamandua tetradactyla TaxID=48850 RepID=UPI0040549F7E